MKKILSFLFIVFSYAAFAQVPEPAMLSLKVIGGNSSDIALTPVTKTADGGFIISYQTTSTTGPIDTLCNASNFEIIFQKYNADASVLEWSKCYGGSGDTFLIYMFPQNDGGIVFGGEYSTGSYGFYICKQDALGNIIWSHGYSRNNGPLLRDMIGTADGGYLMAGNVLYTDTNFTTHYGSYGTDIGVLKLDSLGNKVWSKVIGGTEEDVVSKVVSEPGGGCYILGATLSNNYDCTGNHGGSDAYLARLDKAGNIIWHNDLGGAGEDGGNAGGAYACEDGTGGIIMATISGSADGDVSHQINAGGDNIWVLDVDSGNNILWNNCYGGGGQEYPNSICKAIDGSIWIAGVSQTKGGEVDAAYGNEDAWFVHADNVGNFLSAKVLGSDRQDEGYMIYPLSNGNVIAGGYYEDSGGTFPNIYYGGFEDAFVTIFAPWITGVPLLQQIGNELKIYPNPANEVVTINNERQGLSDLIIIDVIGRIIYKATLNDKIQVQVRDWQRGVYYVEAVNSEGYKQVQKLVVQ